MKNLDRDSARHFRSLLRAARDGVLANAEGFDQVIYEIESLAAFVGDDPSKKGLHGNKGPLVDLASKSALYERDTFSQLFDVFREGRNDHMHEGAAARRLAEQAVAIALILEDALMLAADLRDVQSYMVGSPVCAEPWHTMKMVRRTMLARQFSFLPVRMPDGPWQVVADVHLAAWLPHGPRLEREKRLALTLADAIRNWSFTLITGTTCLPEDPIETARTKLMDGVAKAPILVVDGKENLLGLLTAFDLL